MDDCESQEIPDHYLLVVRMELLGPGESLSIFFRKGVGACYVALVDSLSQFCFPMIDTKMTILLVY